MLKPPALTMKALPRSRQPRVTISGSSSEGITSGGNDPPEGGRRSERGLAPGAETGARAVPAQPSRTLPTVPPGQSCRSPHERSNSRRVVLTARPYSVRCPERASNAIASAALSSPRSESASASGTRLAALVQWMLGSRPQRSVHEPGRGLIRPDRGFERTRQLDDGASMERFVETSPPARACTAARPPPPRRRSVVRTRLFEERDGRPVARRPVLGRRR